jgi:hypothetical protein
MTVFLRSQEEAEHLQASVEAAARTVDISMAQYTEGAVDFTAVYLFQTTLAEQQDDLAASQGDIALGLIGVYRALGGGWQIRLQACEPNAEMFAPPEMEQIPALPAPQANANDIRAQFFLANSTAASKPCDR